MAGLGLVSPGIKVREVDLTRGGITGVSDQTGAIAGPFVKGPINEPTLIENEKDLVDTFGETKNFYNLSNITFLGGSIVNHGGQNPLEAARLGNYIINGPNIGNFKEIYDYLKINKISYTTSKILKMRDIVLSKINKKLPFNKRKKIFRYL